MSSAKVVPKLNTLANESVGKLIIKRVKDILMYLDPEDQKSQIELEKLKKDFLSSSPWPTHEDVFLETIKNLDKECTELKNSTNPTILQNIIVSVLDIVTRLKLTKLDCTKMDWYISESLYSYLHNMTGLKVLTINHRAPLEKISDSDIEVLIMKALSNMKDLEVLTLRIHCTDKILEAVQQNCKKLRILDVGYSLRLTKIGIKSLSMCEQLKEINLESTSIETVGYIELLKKIPNLINIGMCSYIKQILIELYSENRNLTLNLLTVKISQAEPMYLMMISKMFPYLQSLEMNCLNVSDFSELSSLTNLEHLSLVSADFSSAISLLEQIGKQINSLKLRNVKNIDLKCIDTLCPNLKSLLFDECTFQTDEYLVTKSCWGKLFNNLEHLVWNELVSASHLKCLLANCHNVKELGMSDPHGYLSDRDVDDIFRTNPMRKLETLSFEGYTQLSLRSLDTFVSECEKLKKVSNFLLCAPISDSEMKSFTSNNTQLDLSNIDFPEFVMEIIALKSLEYL